jgi:hypothetical protein
MNQRTRSNVRLLTSIHAAATRYVRRLIEARRQRVEKEQEFNRKLDEYRRAHNIPLIDPDD